MPIVTAFPFLSPAQPAAGAGLWSCPPNGSEGETAEDSTSGSSILCVSHPYLLSTTKALTGMNSHDFNCINSDEWHQNLLEGCNDVVFRLTHVIDILKVCHQADVPLSRRLRLAGFAEDILAPVALKAVR